MTGQPDFSILNDLEVGHNFGTNDRLYESRVELGDFVSWVKGNHIAKFGFDGNYLWSLENFPGFTPTRLLVPTGGGNAAACLAVFADFYNGSVGSHVGVPADVTAAEVRLRGRPSSGHCWCLPAVLHPNRDVDHQHPKHDNLGERLSTEVFQPV
jgi:hypothetical protein